MSKPSPKPPLPTTTTDTHPLTNIIIDKKNQRNVSDTSDTLHSKLIRVEQCFRLNPNIARGFRQYAKVKGGKLGAILEEAIIEYMQNNPLPQIRIDFGQEDIRTYTPDIRKEIKLRMAKQGLREAISLLKGKDPRIVKDNLPRLSKAVTRALRLNTTDDELTAMLERAEAYFK